MNAPAAPTAIVLAGHGSRAAAANAALDALAATLASRLALPVRAAFLEMAEPTIGEALRACVESGNMRVMIVPYFLHPGMHVSRDITAIVDAARERDPHVTFTVTDFLGAHPAIGNLLAELAEHALAGHGRPKAV